jgi:hypothetical protein
LTDTVEKGFWGGCLSNIDSRSSAPAQSRLNEAAVAALKFVAEVGGPSASLSMVGTLEINRPRQLDKR